mmetsp:Transcript_41223/g.78745  ORF Transcript_41223/g.78745 Transcript_41223/m.78745 type:complete len:249 (-) Transcript_41223:647-1393(-)
MGCGAEVLEGARVVGLAHDAGHVHDSQVKVRVRRAAVGSLGEILHRLLDILFYSSPSKVHISQAVERVRVALLRALAEKLESCLVVGLHSKTVGVKVSEVCCRVNVSGGRGLREVVQSLLEILVHAARACVEQLADGGLRVGIAHVGGVLEVLHHLLLLARVVARVVVRAQPRALNHGEGPGLTSALDHLLGWSAVVEHRRLTRLGDADSVHMEISQGKLRQGLICVCCKVQVKHGARHVYLDTQSAE